MSIASAMFSSLAKSHYRLFRLLGFKGSVLTSLTLLGVFVFGIYRIDPASIEKVGDFAFIGGVLVAYYSSVIILIEAGRPAASVTGAPASLVVSVLRFLFTQKTFDRIFAQTILDMREEYFEALQNGRVWLARWRHVQLYGVLVITILALAGVNMARLVERIWKAAGPA